MTYRAPRDESRNNCAARINDKVSERCLDTIAKIGGVIAYRRTITALRTRACRVSDVDDDDVERSCASISASNSCDSRRSQKDSNVPLSISSLLLTIDRNDKHTA